MSDLLGARLVTPLEDPRRAQADVYTSAAESAWRVGRADAAARLFAKAAAIEEEVARRTPESLPRTRSVLAISAVALWYKARDCARAERTARWFMHSGEGITPQGRSELEDLVARCVRAGCDP